MNQENDRRNETDIDPAVSDHIKALSDETTPETLDRAVMREARRAIRADNRKGSFGAWFRPLAFIATVALSLAIILDLGDTNIFESSSDSAIEPATPAAVSPALDQPLESAAGNRDQATLKELKRQEKSSAGEGQPQDTRSGISAADDAEKPRQGRMSKLQPAAPADAPQAAEPRLPPPEEHAAGGDAFYTESRHAGERVQEAGADYDAAALGRSATRTQSPAPRPSAEALLQATPTACSEQQKSAPDEWWKCIEALREAGQAELARLEAKNLRNAFPDFVPAQ